MSLVFSDTTTKRGIVQQYEQECGYEYGDVSGDATKLLTLTADVNLALDDFMALAFHSEGTWQADDYNQTDFAIITTDLIAGQRDYTFVTDQDGNLILEIYKVFARSSVGGPYYELNPVDVETGENMQQNPMAVASGLLYYGGLTSFTDGLDVRGNAVRYDKMANGVFLDPVPSLAIPDGLKMYVNREASYFVSTDTSKRPGVPGLFHRYFVLKPAVDYARRNGADNFGTLSAELLKYEGNPELGIDGSIRRYFAKRMRDERQGMRAGQHSNR